MQTERRKKNKGRPRLTAPKTRTPTARENPPQGESNAQTTGNQPPTTAKATARKHATRQHGKQANATQNEGATPATKTTEATHRHKQTNQHEPPAAQNANATTPAPTQNATNTARQPPRAARQTQKKTQPKKSQSQNTATQRTPPKQNTTKAEASKPLALPKMRRERKGGKIRTKKKRGCCAVFFLKFYFCQPLCGLAPCACAKMGVLAALCIGQ